MSYSSFLRIVMTGFIVFFTGCNSQVKPPMVNVPHVDLQKFMGSWFVIANIPTFIEKGAHNAVETYRMNPDGTVQTTFSYRQDNFDGVEKIYTPTGFVIDKTTNAVWEMQFLWPFKSDYRIIYLNENYTQTVIGREKRDYVWIMAREPEISDNDYRNILDLLNKQGYETSKIEKVPQRWSLSNPSPSTSQR